MRTAIIIGASSGLGLEVASQLIDSGWRVGVAARRVEPLQALVDKAPGRVVAAQIDVAAADAPQRLRQLIAHVGGMQLYFHAAGIGKQNMLLEPGIEVDTMHTNGVGFAQMVGEAFRHMAGQGGGQIAAITSIAGTKGMGAAPAYSATKAMQAIYLQALDQLAAMRRLPIAITDLRAGFVDTPLLDSGRHYPMMMQPRAVATAMLRAVMARRHVVVIDWRWHFVAMLWRLLPAWLWRRMRIGN